MILIRWHCAMAYRIKIINNNIIYSRNPSTDKRSYLLNTERETHFFPDSLYWIFVTIWTDKTMTTIKFVSVLRAVFIFNEMKNIYSDSFVCVSLCVCLLILFIWIELDICVYCSCFFIIPNNYDWKENPGLYVYVCVWIN